jgi:hypothetical protein
MGAFIFRCPITNLNVQHWVDDDDETENEFQGLICPACTRLHFINPKSGKLLGDEKE